MKIAYFGYDFFSEVLRRLVKDAHDVSHVFTCEFEEGDDYNSNRNTVALAESIGAKLVIGRPQDTVLEQLADEGCELAIVAGYIYKLRPSERLRALNLHPTLLPLGRGPYPLPWLLLERPDAAGLTLHKLSDEMDAGDVVDQQRIVIDGSETLELLVARLQVAAPPFVSATTIALDRAWSAARPQGEGIYWKASEQDWTIDWSRGVVAALRTVRAFGRTEASAPVEGQTWSVSSAEGWLEEHLHAPGTLVQRVHTDLVVAASDGFVLLKNARLDP